MSLGEHLVELRKRLFRSAIAVVVAAVVGFALGGYVLDFLRAPIERVAENANAAINYGGVTTGFDVRFQIAITLGIVLASPIWLYQLFAFFVPGLTKKEKRYVVGFILTAIPLFFAGCAAGLFVFPNIVTLMMSFVPSTDFNLLDAKFYLDFVLKLVVAVGIAFVMPVFLVLLNFMGVVSAAAIIKGWRWAILAIALFAAIATPAADLVSMFLLALPMVGLFFLAVGVAWLHDRGAAKRAAKLDAAAADA